MTTPAASDSDEPLAEGSPPENLQLEESASFDRQVIHYIQRAAATGLYEIRGLGAKRRLPHFDDLVFLGASLSRYPLEGYARNALRPHPGHHALRSARSNSPCRLPSRHELRGTFRECEGSPRAGCHGVGDVDHDRRRGMTPEERRSSKTLVYQCLPSRYGFNPDDVRKADAIEIVIGRVPSRAAAACLLGQKVSPRVAAIHTRRTNLHVDRLCQSVISRQLLDLDLEIVRAGPVGCGTPSAIHTSVERVRHRATRGLHFLSQQHAAAARLAPWPMTISMASALRTSSGLNPYRDGRHW